MSILKGLEKIGLAAVDTVLMPVDAVADVISKKSPENSATKRRAKRVVQRAVGGLKEIYDNEEILPSNPRLKDVLDDDEIIL